MGTADGHSVILLEALYGSRVPSYSVFNPAW